LPIQALNIADAAQCIAQGAVLAYPTESVWGLGCDPFNQEAVAAILALKERPVEKGLIVVAANTLQLMPFFADSLLENTEQLAAIENAERPTTFIVPVNNEVPFWLSGKHQSLAVRVSRHPVVKALCEKAGPLVSTSANPAGKMAAKERFQVQRYFADSVYYSQGRVGRYSRPSRIIDLKTGTIVRD
jgi:L-threonylcarbamoyladenylate synthase